MADPYAGSMIGGAMKASAPPQSAADEIASRLSNIHDRFLLATDRMHRILDRAYGAAPEALSQKNPREVPSGAIGSISARLDDIERIGETQIDLLGRLDKIV